MKSETVPGTGECCKVPFFELRDTFGRSGETGRRRGLKILRPQGHDGSIPSSGTNKIEGLQRCRPFLFGAEIDDCARNCARLGFEVGGLLLCGEF